jgi:hypothetical protein
MLCDDGSSSSSSNGSNGDDGDSIDSVDTTDALIFAAAYESSKDKLKFAEMKRYLLPRGKYRKSNDDVFINDLNDGVAAMDDRRRIQTKIPCEPRCIGSYL